MEGNVLEASKRMGDLRARQLERLIQDMNDEVSDGRLWEVVWIESIKPPRSSKGQECLQMNVILARVKLLPREWSSDTEMSQRGLREQITLRSSRRDEPQSQDLNIGFGTTPLTPREWRDRYPVQDDNAFPRLQNMDVDDASSNRLITGNEPAMSDYHVTGQQPQPSNRHISEWDGRSLASNRLQEWIEDSVPQAEQNPAIDATVRAILEQSIEEVMVSDDYKLYLGEYGQHGDPEIATSELLARAMNMVNQRLPARSGIPPVLPGQQWS
jgi:hypothetical protein